jgi:adenylate cyclase
VLWYSDLRGFTKIAESLPSEELIQFLNEYFECLVDPVHERGGQVLKFMGDSVLAIFPVDSGPDVCRTALDASDDALERVKALNVRRKADGLTTTEIYVAMHLGDVNYGNIGSRDRLDFTVVGPAVNEVTRIEDMCRTLEQTVVISSAFAEAAGGCTDRLVSLGRYALRGVRQPQELFTLVRQDAYEIVTS